MTDPEGLFHVSEAMLDPRLLDETRRLELLDVTYNEVLSANGGTFWLSAGAEASMLWDATLDTFVRGIWAATIVCAHGVCERTIAGVMNDWYAVRPEPKGWRRWGTGQLVEHLRDEGLVDGRVLDAVRFVNEARIPLVHWRAPDHPESLSGIGLAGYQRGVREPAGETSERHVAQAAYVCARTALQVHFGDLSRHIGRPVPWLRAT